MSELTKELGDGIEYLKGLAGKMRDAGWWGDPDEIEEFCGVLERVRDTHAFIGEATLIHVEHGWLRAAHWRRPLDSRERKLICEWFCVSGDCFWEEQQNG